MKSLFLPLRNWSRGNRLLSEDAVRLRAYELYLERGAIPGDDVRDWLQAERELLTNQLNGSELGKAITWSVTWQPFTLGLLDCLELAGRRTLP